MVGQDRARMVAKRYKLKQRNYAATILPSPTITFLQKFYGPPKKLR